MKQVSPTFSEALYFYGSHLKLVISLYPGFIFACSYIPTLQQFCEVADFVAIAKTKTFAKGHMDTPDDCKVHGREIVCFFYPYSFM